ncbi:helix-turn-helix transcriptional regulator [Salinimicrobium sp. TIG7-5_MAKvit]|uniref:helix-turn-helix domain-containing protein n=1 Tax=Salinimicrobium sp. TIG7-5_MAKvit TaxID=3121289 RepID=UPI003C6EA203
MQNKNYKESFLIKFGHNFGKIRQSKNLSFRSLSQKCDLDYADLNKIEKGKRNITLTTIFELATGLDVHPRELFDFHFPDQDEK